MEVIWEGVEKGRIIKLRKIFLGFRGSGVDMT